MGQERDVWQQSNSQTSRVSTPTETADWRPTSFPDVKSNCETPQAYYSPLGNPMCLITYEANGINTSTREVHGVNYLRQIAPCDEEVGHKFPCDDYLGQIVPWYEEVGHKFPYNDELIRVNEVVKMRGELITPRERQFDAYRCKIWMVNVPTPAPQIKQKSRLQWTVMIILMMIRKKSLFNYL
jgi:hypothetical protein